MPKLTFIQKDGSKLEIEAAQGLSVMEIAQKYNIEEIEGACGGSLSCATCHGYVHPDWVERCLPEDGEISEDEEDMLDLAFELRKTSRLCCQIRVKEDLDGLIIAVPGAPVDW